jgi:hypothetical protein
LNCFSRGGSNILWNIFLSHPQACSPIRETLEIFSIDPRAPKLEGYMVILLSRQWRIFDQWNLALRRPLTPSAKNYIDRTLYRWKLKTLCDDEMKFKNQNQIYTTEEVEKARLVIKNNNGLTFASDLFKEIYPQATFIALVRHPLALYESHKRRKTPVSNSIEEFADYYLEMTAKMLADANDMETYFLIKFEELLAQPVASMQTLYNWAGLDMGLHDALRFKAKPHMRANGSHATDFTSGRHYWFPFDEAHRILEPKVNYYQMDLVSEDEKYRLNERLGELMGALGYEVEK